MLIDYTHSNRQRCPFVAAKPLYSYITAANGIFIRAERENLSVQLPLTLFSQPVRGIEPLNAHLTLPKLVPLKILGQILQISQQALPNEALFYLDYHRDAWRLIVPDQIQTPGSVRPADCFDTQESIVIEIHSHNSMKAFFSATDDAEETGFRIYGVLGRVDTDRPELRMRVGIYGQFISTSHKSIFGVVYEN